MNSNSDATVLVVDLAGTHRLFEQMGQGPANRLIGRLLGGIGQAIEYYGGRVVKTVGDEILAEYQRPDQAIATAIHVQREMKSHSEASKHGLSTRIGMHHGPITRTANDIFGPTVVAARGVTALAKRQQILLPQVLRNWSSTKTPSVHRGRHQISGIESEIEIVEIDWARAVASDLLRAAGRPTPPNSEGLVFRSGTTSAVCDPDQPKVGIGRRPSADIILGFSWVSRDHASIELTQTGCVLTDASRNGTWVYVERTPAAATPEDRNPAAEHPDSGDPDSGAAGEATAPRDATRTIDPDITGERPVIDALVPRVAPNPPMRAGSPPDDPLLLTHALTHLRGESIALAGRGWIGIGRPSTNPETLIEFRPASDIDPRTEQGSDHDTTPSAPIR